MADYVFYVTVSGGKFVIDSVSQQTVDLGHTITYQFDQSDSTNSGHPLRLSTTSDGTHAGGGASEYQTGVTTDGTPGNAGAYTEISVTSSTPATLYYYCSNHSGMGGQVNTTASEFANTSGVALKKPILANATNKWGNYSNQNLDTIAGKLPQSFVFPTGTGANNQVLSSDGSGGTSWADVALTPEITAITWYSDSSYSSVLSTSEAINIDDATYLKVTGTNLGTSGAFGASAHVQIINTTQSSAVVGNNQSGLTGCVTASSWQSNLEWRFTINPNNVSGISSGDTLKVKAVTSGGESLFGTGYVISADPTSVTTVNSATINNNDSVGSFGGLVAGGGQDSNTKLLLNFDRTGGTDIEDSSNTGGNGHKVTVNNNAVIKASPFGDGKSAIFFDGSNDYLEIADSSDFDFGASSGNTNDFTIELWFYAVSLSGDRVFISRNDHDGTDSEWYVRNDDNAYNYYRGKDTEITTVNSVFETNKWQHLALVRNGTNVSVYVDGKRISSVTDADSWEEGTGDGTHGHKIIIGARNTGSAGSYAQKFSGYMDEIRIVKGTAVYTSDFTVPTSRLTAITNTKLLIHSNQTYDSSDNNLHIEQVGNPLTSPTTTNKYGGSAWRVAGSSASDVTSDQYLKVGNGNAILTSGDWTIEFWGKDTSASSTQGWFTYWKDSSNTFKLSNYGQLEFYANIGGTSQNSGSTQTRDTNWHHYAVVYDDSATTLTIYRDGSQASQNTSFTLDINASSMQGGFFALGARTDNGTDFNQYSSDCTIDDFRITHAKVYTGNFTAPTSALTKTWSSSTGISANSTSSNVKLLVHGNHAGTDNFDDSSTSNHTITPTGSYHSQAHGGIAPAMTFPASLKKTGSAGVYFDGDGDYLEIPYNADLNYGVAGQAYSIDMWIYPTEGDTSNGHCIYMQGTDSSNRTLLFYYGTNGIELVTRVSGSTTLHKQTNSGTNTPIPLHQWSHIALTRDTSGVHRIYINGKYQINGTDNSSNGLTSNHFIGKHSYANTSYFKGYIDCVRFQKDVVLYNSSESTTNAYTVPTKIYGAFKPDTIDTITLTGSAGSGGGYVTFNNATLSGNTETTSALPAGLSLNETEDANNTATITGDLTETPGDYSIQLVARVTSDGTDANIDPNRKQNYSHTINKGSGGKPVLFNARRYVGNDTARDINLYGFQPDLVWAKARSVAYRHGLWDSVRGPTKYLRSEANDAQTTATDGLTSFNADGFSAGDDSSTDNINGTQNYIAWAWKAGGAPSGNGKKKRSNSTSEDTLSSGTDYSTNISSIKQSVNVAGDFSITQYTPSNDSDTWIKHGLSGKPDWIIAKRTDSANHWHVWHTGFGGSGGAGEWILLNEGRAKSVWATGADGSTYEAFGVIDATKINFDGATPVSGSGQTFICYAWKAVAGVSAFGTYSGDGSNAVTVSNIGFKPRFLMVKSISGTLSWHIVDSFRFGGDTGNQHLYADVSQAELNTASHATTFFSTNGGGFTLTGTSTHMNGANQTYIYMAFA